MGPYMLNFAMQNVAEQQYFWPYSKGNRLSPKSPDTGSLKQQFTWPYPWVFRPLEPPTVYVSSQFFSFLGKILSLCLTFNVLSVWCGLSCNEYRRLNNNSLSGPVPLPLANLPRLTFLWVSVLPYSLSLFPHFCSVMLILVLWDLFFHMWIMGCSVFFLNISGICPSIISVDLFLLFQPKHLSKDSLYWLITFAYYDIHISCIECYNSVRQILLCHSLWLILCVGILCFTIFFMSQFIKCFVVAAFLEILWFVEATLVKNALNPSWLALFHLPSTPLLVNLMMLSCSLFNVV